MEGSEYLYTIAEVSVAFVGFAAIAIAIRHRSHSLGNFERLLVAWLVERGLAALAFALLPILLYYITGSSQKILQYGSGLLAVYLLTVFIRVYPVFRNRQTTVPIGPAGRFLRVAMVGVMIPVQALAGLGVLPFNALGWYLLGVTWLLVMSGATFATILTTRHS